MTPNGVAFFAYLSKDEPNPGTHKTFVFDVDHTNIGGHYSHHTGVFTCPSHSVYVFSWSIYCSVNGYNFSELVNSSSVSGTFVDSQSVSNSLSSTDLVIVVLNAGDEVYIRTPLNLAAIKNVIRNSLHRSTFSGLLITCPLAARLGGVRMFTSSPAFNTTITKSVKDRIFSVIKSHDSFSNPQPFSPVDSMSFLLHQY